MTNDAIRSSLDVRIWGKFMNKYDHPLHILNPKIIR